MKKILLFIAVLAFSLKSYGQVIATTDTIRELYYTSYSKFDQTFHKRISTQYSPSDEDVYQNFSDLYLQKIKVEGINYYALVYNKISVVKYSTSGYITMALEFGRKSASQYDSFNNSFYFIMNQKQYDDLKKCVRNGDMNTLRIKTKMNGDRYIGEHTVKAELKEKNYVEMTFAVSCDTSIVKFRLPDQYHLVRFTKKLFNNNHFECSLSDFENFITQLDER